MDLFYSNTYRIIKRFLIAVDKILEYAILEAVLVHIWYTNVNKMGDLANKPFSADLVKPHEI